MKEDSKERCCKVPRQNTPRWNQEHHRTHDHKSAKLFKSRKKSAHLRKTYITIDKNNLIGRRIDTLVFIWKHKRKSQKLSEGRECSGRESN
jgi:hypothetical protein